MKSHYKIVNIGLSSEISARIYDLAKNSHFGTVLESSLEGSSLSLQDLDKNIKEDSDLLILGALSFSCPLTEVISFLKRKLPLTEIILIVFQQNYQLAINAFRGGVRDIIEYPLQEEDFLTSLNRSLTYRSLIRRSENLTKIMGFFNLFGDYRQYETRDQLFLRIDEFLKKKFGSTGYMIMTYGKSPGKNSNLLKKNSVYWNETLLQEEKGKGYGEFFEVVEFPNFKNHEPQFMLKRAGNQNYYFFNLGLWEKKHYLGAFKVGHALEEEMLGYLSRILYNAFQQIIHFTVERELSLLAHSDDVTGLYNQRRLQVDIERAIESVNKNEGSFTLLFIDIDHFKKINDQNGHLVGSLVLGEVANELRKVVRETDLIYRYGGDEFVIILPNTKKDLGKDIGGRILNTLRLKKFHNGLSNKDDGSTFHLSVSIGVAEYPMDAKSKEDILRLADQMMYQAKESGRGQVRIFNEFFLTGNDR